MSSIFHHRQIIVNGVNIHLAEAGDPQMPVILFLHGYPENWAAFKDVMVILKDRYHVLAIDLPGIGSSQNITGRDKIAGSDKRTIAGFVSSMITTLNLKDLTLVGHDVGGMVTYSLLKYYPANIRGAVIMDTAIPGIDPWEEVKRNPYIWHFAFFAIPRLPEILSAGKQQPLFDYFYNVLSYDKDGVGNEKRKEYIKAYSEEAAMTAGFDWYRAFPQDEKDNAAAGTINIPLLYIRGERDSGKLEDYTKGFLKAGVADLSSKVIPGSGHFAPDERPKEVARAIDDFFERHCT
jgi:pimeloyl-ACP methyl ester carboxylesterase